MNPEELSEALIGATETEFERVVYETIERVLGDRGGWLVLGGLSISGYDFDRVVVPVARDEPIAGEPGRMSRFDELVVYVPRSTPLGPRTEFDVEPWLRRHLVELQVREGVKRLWGRT